MTLKPLIWWKKKRIFSLKIEKKYWMVTDMFLPFSSVQWDWMVTEKSLNKAWNPGFSEDSVSIQWTFKNVSVDWKENFILWCRCHTIKIPPCLNAMNNVLFLHPFTDNDDVSIWVRYFSIWAPVFHKVLTFNTMVKVMTCKFESRSLEDPVIKICWVKTIWILL